jgi:hypothetical protein
MAEINWEKIASDAGLSTDKFRREILIAAAAVGSLILDEPGAEECEAIRYSVEGVEVIISRIDTQENKND